MWIISLYKLFKTLFKITKQLFNHLLLIVLMNKFKNRKETVTLFLISGNPFAELRINILVLIFKIWCNQKMTKILILLGIAIIF